MKNSLKITLLLILGIALFILPNKVFAGTYGQLTYEIKDDDTVAIKDCDENATSITVPSKIAGYPVTEIYGSIASGAAFEDCTKLESVTLPSSVEEIGCNAFYNCTSLKSITIPKKVKEIQYNTFQNCTSLTNVTIPESVTEIQSDAFNGCTSLQSITLPNSLEDIGGGCFENCTSLKSIKIPSKIKELRYGTFMNCKNLSSVSLPYDMRTLGYCVFQGCTSLTSITLPKKLTAIDGDCFRDCTNLKNVTIKGYITNISGYAFKDCTSLSKVTIYRTDYLYIADDAFEDTNANISFNVVKGSDAYKWALNNDKKYTVIKVPLSYCYSSKTSNKKYTGKAIKQSITVKYCDNDLVNGTDYKISYKNNKYVGKATMTITGIGNYTGTITKTFKINPNSVSIKSLSAISKGFTAKWGLRTTQTTGYQIQYATNSKYTNNVKKISVKSNKTTSKKFTKLKASKKYYVRIRTYKTVNGVKYYSAWSKSKTVTTKK